MSAADKGDTGNIWLNHDGMLIIYPGPRKNYEAYLKDSEVYTLRSKLLISASTASTALDWDRYNLFIVDVSASTTFSIDNARPDSDFVIVLRKDGTGSTYNLTWPASLTWLITPVISLTTADEEVVLQVSYYDGTFRVGYFTGQVTTLTAPGSTPPGGTANQVLSKNSGTDYDYSWITLGAPSGLLVAANNLSDLISAPTARTNLGLGTAATLNVGLAANNIVQLDGSGQIDPSLLPSASAAPVGALMPFAGSSTPSGWLLCYGSAVSRVTYADLFAAIGTTYGVGDGSTTFNLPDLRGRVPVGKDDMGGSGANRMTTAGGGIDGDTLGAAGGTETHTLTTPEIPSHSHTTSARFTGGATTAMRMSSFNDAAASTIDSGNAGGGGAHPNVQPGIIINYIIKH